MSCCQQPGSSGKGVGGHGEDEAGTHPLDAAIDGLCHSTDGFGPAVRLRLESAPWRGRMKKRTIRTEEQIIGIQQEHEAGAKCADICRKHGMSEGTYYA